MQNKNKALRKIRLALSEKDIQFIKENVIDTGNKMRACEVVGFDVKTLDRAMAGKNIFIAYRDGIIDFAKEISQLKEISK